MIVGEEGNVGYLDKARLLGERAYVSTCMAATTMVLANTVGRGDLVVHADDPFLKQAELSIPSALPAPSLGPVQAGHAIGIGSQIVETAISAESARTTTPIRGLIGTAITAQLASCGADAAVERTGWLSHAERAQEDVGFSAINVAWFFKFLLDRAESNLDKGHRWLAGATAFAGTAAIGLPLSEGANGGKLDFVAHSTGLIVGYAAHKLSNRRQQTTAT